MTNDACFLSAATCNFEAIESPYPGLRTRLADEIEKVGPRPYVQERFRQVADDTLEKLVGYITKSSSVIHILGHLPGWIAEDRAVKHFLKKYPTFLSDYPELRQSLGNCMGISYTQWEAYLALHFQIPLNVYCTPNAQSNPQQQKHMLRLADHAGRYAQVFKTPEELYRLILMQLFGEIFEGLQKSHRGRRLQGILLATILLVSLTIAVVVLFSNERLQTRIARWKSETSDSIQVEKEKDRQREEQLERDRIAAQAAATKSAQDQNERNQRESEKLARSLEAIDQSNQKLLEQQRRDQEEQLKREKAKAAELAQKQKELADLILQNQKTDMPRPPEDNLNNTPPEPYVPPDGFILCVFRTDGKSITIDNGNQRPKVYRYYPGAGIGASSRILPNGTIEADTIFDGFGIITDSKQAPKDLIVTVTRDGAETEIPAAEPIAIRNGAVWKYKHSYLANELPKQGKAILKAYIKAK